MSRQLLAIVRDPRAASLKLEVLDGVVIASGDLDPALAAQDMIAEVLARIASPLNRDVRFPTVSLLAFSHHEATAQAPVCLSLEWTGERFEARGALPIASSAQPFFTALIRAANASEEATAWARSIYLGNAA